jgi:hypothetical protein
VITRCYHCSLPDNLRIKLFALVVFLAPNGMVKEDTARSAAHGAVITPRRNLQCSCGLVKENEPVRVTPARIKKFKQSLPFDDPIVVGLVLVVIPLLEPVASVRRACSLSMVLY